MRKYPLSLEIPGHNYSLLLARWWLQDRTLWTYLTETTEPFLDWIGWELGTHVRISGINCRDRSGHFTVEMCRRPLMTMEQFWVFNNILMYLLFCTPGTYQVYVLTLPSEVYLNLMKFPRSWDPASGANIYNAVSYVDQSMNSSSRL